MRCPNCDEAELVRDIRDLPYFYKGEETVLPQVKGEFCPACNESVVDMTEAARTMALIFEFNQQVNASVIGSAF
ncbi:MAG: type II toxin-antitoxin system MqsA family antitoxin [Burkholderiaceae bacterium]